MKTVIEMARLAGAELCELPRTDAVVFGVDDLEWNSAALQRFAELVRADEREACAKVVEASPSYDWHKFACEAAAAIRARSNT